MGKRYRTVTELLSALDKEFNRGLRDIGRVVTNRQAARLNNVTRRWKHKIVFHPAVNESRGKLRLVVKAEGDEESLAVFGYVDEGTKPHDIFPKKPGGMLMFNVPYKAMTAAVNIPNAGTGKSGDTQVFSRGVHHPGTEARLFTKTAQMQAVVEFKQRFDELVDRLNQ